MTDFENYSRKATDAGDGTWPTVVVTLGEPVWDGAKVNGPAFFYWPSGVYAPPDDVRDVAP